MSHEESVALAGYVMLSLISATDVAVRVLHRKSQSDICMCV